jgi:plasmid stabilization system protein ParE
MAYRIRYLPKALQQLDSIFTYLADRNPAAAHRVSGYPAKHRKDRRLSP